MSGEERVSVDFDGVLHSYKSGWTGYRPTDEPEPGALDFISDLMGEGYTPVVVSARADCEEGVTEIRKWLALWGFPEMEVTGRKVAAVAYVDDRAVHYQPGSKNWAGVLNHITDLAGRRE